jgi:hypothetical protein
MSRRFIALGAIALGALASAAAAQVQVQLVAQVGQMLPLNAGTATALNTPVVNGLGQVGFSGTLNTGTNTTGFAFNNDRVVHRNADVATPTLTGVEGTMGINNTGGFIISPTVSPSLDAVYTHEGVLLQEGDPAPGFAGKFSVFNSRPTMSPDGTAYWVAGIGPTSTNGDQDVLYRATPSGGRGGFTITPVVFGGQTVGSEQILAEGLEFAYDVSDNNAHVLQRANLNSGAATDAVILKNGAVAEREGSIPTGGTAAWQNFRHMGVNNAGNYLVYGDDSSTTDDILVYNGAVVMRQGSTLDGLTLGTTIDAAAINNLDQIVQLWDLPGTGQEGLFFGSASDVGASVLLVRTGDTLDVNGDNVADFTLTDFNASTTISKPLDFGDAGVVYVDVDLTPIAGGTVVESIIAVAVPEPATVSLALISTAALLARRRRH